MRHLWIGALVVSAGLAGGCVSDDPRKPSMVGQSGPNTPNPTRMVVTSYLPRDTNSNGSPDLIQLRVHLFEAEGGWPLAVSVPGTFRFELVTPGEAGREKPLATWEIDPATMPRMLTQDQVGPCYLVELSLLSEGRTDRLSVETVDLHASFISKERTANPIRSVISMHFGRTR